ncbi:MAG: phosphate ABC transporter permease subunit PstC [Candidatus Omnitrophica bacterium CG11_big_fil_rev_8_21_14_0_20_45_26]|uniref:Phosphate transport system permease protein n=1 Tax=Candidatus Abzuiibacterium crystallinum TaxID=1974748 RepID=A0A2H0LRW0_9BACT|nr:MAG: phosphate ABC transporter permease subunit PstC [Candidatus Omnitrophica bacterium CG11_big_fil_rev_8_21_14_0_20_45_26]
MAISQYPNRTHTARGRTASLSWTAILSFAFAFLGWAFLFGMVVYFLVQGLRVFQFEGLGFLMNADWQYRRPSFGAASMIYGSIVVCAVAVSTAGPLALGAAVFTSEFLTGKTRILIKALMEMLATVPSVIYGLLGVLLLRPFVFDKFSVFSPETGDNLLTAGLLLGVMILPTILSLSDDAFRSVSREERDAALSLGLTEAEVFMNAVFPKVIPGIISAFLLGIGRAFGETIAVFLVVGRADNRLPNLAGVPHSLLEAGQTLTSKLGGSEVNLAYGSPLHWSAMMGLAFLLMLIVVVIVAIGTTVTSFYKRGLA